MAKGAQAVRRFLAVFLLLFVGLQFGTMAWALGASPAPSPGIAVADLPPEARQTLALIQRGGPFPYDRDGIVFNNREGRLPDKSRGYYREYTVKTPGVSHRGARRIVAGGKVEFWYTADHYRTFQRIRE